MELKYLTCDPVYAPDVPQPTARSILIPGAQGNLLSHLYLPGGCGPYPTVLLCHGYPGNEQNIDLAVALRRIGFAVMVFHYAGSWNSPGNFSLTGALGDANAVLDFMLAHAQEYDLDTTRFAVVGHSMGGMVAAHLSAKRPELSCGVLMAPWDPGRCFLRSAEDKIAHDNLWEVLSCAYGWLNGISEEGFVRELTAHADELCLAPLAPQLAAKPILCLAGQQDIDTPIPLHAGPLRDAIRAAGGRQFTYQEFPCDHSFSPLRITLCRTVAAFLAEQLG
ncbi:MAG: alpha/beta fold hydrolase [Clostridiales bacterium]|nr:alpha/beta fold hydrolase [Candidatus Cacconaster stercorequi]